MKLNYYSTGIKYLYYILFFVLPFVVLPVNSELFEFNKMLFIYTISALILGMWVLVCLQENKIILKKTPFDLPLSLFLGGQVLSTLFSIDQHTSFFGYYGRFNGGLLSTFVYIFLFYGFVTHMTEQPRRVIRNIFAISLFSSILVVLWGLPGKFNHDLSCLLFTSKFDNSCWTAQFRPAERMFSTLGQPNWFGAYLGITFFIGIYFFLTSAKFRSQILSFLGILFSFAGILLSRSRSSLLSLVPGLLLFALFYAVLIIRKSHWLNSHKKKYAIGVVGALIVLSVLCQTGIPQIDNILTLSFLKRKAPIVAPPVAPATETKPSLVYVGGVTESLDIRKIVWQGAWELGQQYPLFGTGVETFGYAYYSVRPQSHNMTSEWDYLYNKAHNEYLNLLATTGWVGLGTFLILLGSILLYFFHKIKDNKGDMNSVSYYLALLGIVISIIITNFFGFSITVINVYWYLLMAWLIMYDAPPAKSEHANANVSISKSGIAILLVLWLLNSLYSYWSADYKYAQSDIALKSNNSAAAANLLQEALALREEHVYQDKLSYALAQYAFVASYQKEKEKAKQIIEASENLNLKSIQSSSQNVLYWKTRVKNQFIFYQMTLDKKYLFTGLSALEEALKLAPTDPKIPYFSATYYSLLYDDEKNSAQKIIYRDNSMKAIEKALVLKSDYGDAYYLKVQLLRKYGQRAQAKELLEWYIPRYAPTNEDIKKELKDLN